MLICEEQKNPVEFYGKNIFLSDKTLNAHWNFCTTPVDHVTIGAYLGSHFIDTEFRGKNEQELAGMLSENEICKIVEQGIKDEIIDSVGEDYWNSIPD